MHGIFKDRGIKRVFIIGAGFSAPFGMPLTDKILALVYEIALAQPLEGEQYGQASRLLKELQWYFPTMEITHELIQSGKLQIDVEQFLSYVCAVSAFGENFADGDDLFVCLLRSWIGEAIYKAQCECFLKPIPFQYLSFVQSLRGSMILTFNWDTIIEELLDRAEKSYVFDFHSAFQTEAVPLIKLHGSVDWFSDPHPFNRDWMCHVPISEHNPGIVRAKGKFSQYRNYGCHPLIVVPSYDKINRVKSLGSIWETPWFYLQDELEVVIIGFSMRPDDYHSRAVIYPQLVHGSRKGHLKIKVIDFADNDDYKNEIRKRYDGVENCRFWFEGFSGNVQDFIEN